MSEEPTNGHDEIEEALRRLHSDEAAIRAAYEALPKDWLRSALLVEYRCPNKRGCLLLHAWSGEAGRTYFYVPAYTLSRRRNAEESVESARAKYTLDGDRVWRPRAGRLHELRDGREWNISIGVQCDHLQPVVVTPAQLLEDAATARSTRRLTRRGIAARYAHIPLE